MKPPSRLMLIFRYITDESNAAGKGLAQREALSGRNTSSMNSYIWEYIETIIEHAHRIFKIELFQSVSIINYMNELSLSIIALL